jgi:hypothetical protein
MHCCCCGPSTRLPPSSRHQSLPFAHCWSSMDTRYHTVWLLTFPVTVVLFASLLPSCRTCTALPAAKELAGKIYENFVETVKTINRASDDAEVDTSGGEERSPMNSDSQRAPNPKPKSVASRPGVSGYDMLMGVAPEEPASDSSPSRGMTAALRDINVSRPT